MKKIKSLGYVLAVLTLAVPLISLAAEFRAGEQPSVQVNEKITNDLYITGGTVTVLGNVPGDLVAGGGNVVVSGDVGADFIAGAGNVTILSNVGDDVRIAGGNVVIQGKIKGDAVLGGGQITIGGAGVGGDLIIAGGNIRIEAPVSGKVSIKSGDVYINAPIAGDVKIKAGKVKLGSKAVISGDLTYKSSHELSMEEGAVVKGKINYTPFKKQVSGAAILALLSALIIWKFFALLGSAFLLGLIFKRYSKEIVSLVTKRPLFELGRGLLTLAALPVISVLLFATVIGIPLGILGITSLVAVMLFSWIVASIILGSVVYKYFSKKDLEVSWKTILLGVFLYSLLGLVPFIGWLVQCLLMLLALGGIVAFKIQIMKDWK